MSAPVCHSEVTGSLHLTLAQFCTWIIPVSCDICTLTRRHFMNCTLPKDGWKSVIWILRSYEIFRLQCVHALPTLLSYTWTLVACVLHVVTSPPSEGTDWARQWGRTARRTFPLSATPSESPNCWLWTAEWRTSDILHRLCHPDQATDYGQWWASHQPVGVVLVAGVIVVWPPHVCRRRKVTGGCSEVSQW